MADRFIVLSEPFRQILSTFYGADESKIRVVPGGVDVDRFKVSRSKAESREQMGWPTDRPVILSIRRLVQRVGLLEMIEAMPHVRRHVSEVCLLIAGKGPLAKDLEARIQSLGLEGHVKLLGFIPDEDLPTAYRAADLSVVPTQELEGFGLVAVESLAAGTPVLVTPVGGLPEVVRGLSSDLIMEGKSVDVIGEHLVAALRGSLHLPDSATCQRFAASHYDWSNIVEKVRSVYDEVI
jgi:glycosyltransferase involved in cell wall biosynthesis